jgi:hypothetical protein
MPFIYRNVIHLEQKPKVDGGECARLVQHYLAHIGQTSTWRPGENVIDVLASGRQIEPERRSRRSLRDGIRAGAIDMLLSFCRRISAAQTLQRPTDAISCRSG